MEVRGVMRVFYAYWVAVVYGLYFMGFETAATGMLRATKRASCLAFGAAIQ
jgi:hypothetical protein